MSVYQLMFRNSIFLKKAKLNVFLTFFLPKSNTFRQLSPLDRRSLKPTFRQLHFVNKISRLFMCKISRNILKRGFHFQRDILCCRRASESRKGILYEAF